MKLNTLRIEPHLVMPEISQEHYANKNGLTLWRIWIDENLITEFAYPFEKTEAMIDMSIDPSFPLWGDVNGFIYVRKLNQYIIWTNLELIERYTSWAYREIELFVFHSNLYEQQCDKAMQTTELPELITFQNRRIYTHEEIKTDEVKKILLAFFPKDADEYVIYRQPIARLDTTGAIIVRRIRRAITETEQFKICPTPEKTIELKLGLDLPEFVEAIWHIGRCEEGFAIYFEDYPYFPAWLYSEKLSKVLEQEEFTKEL